MPGVHGPSSRPFRSASIGWRAPGRRVYIPASYTGQTNLPLVILLHGYSASGTWQEGYMQFRPWAEARRFLYCYPDGTVDRWGKRFWNATDAGCDFGNTGVDDAGYLRGLIEEIGRTHAVDRKRIYLIGHSNGGRMANRMACESADLIAGIASDHDSGTSSDLREWTRLNAPASVLKKKIR